jgi:anti-sigma factor RsiW
VNCTGVIHELSDYIDGSLATSIRHELEQHLQHCRDCTVIVHQTRTSVEILVRCKPEPLAADVKKRLHQRLREKLHKKPD